MKKLIISAILFFSLIFAQPAMALTEQEVLAIRGQINILLQIIVELQKQLAQLIEQQKQLVQTTNQLLPPVSGATGAIESPIPVVVEPDTEIELKMAAKDESGWVVSIENKTDNFLYFNDIALILKKDNSVVKNYEDVRIGGYNFSPLGHSYRNSISKRNTKYKDLFEFAPREITKIRIQDPGNKKYSGIKYIEKGFTSASPGGYNVLFPDLYFEK